MFLWGAVFAVIIGIILEAILALPFQVVGPLNQYIARRFGDPDTFILILVALVIAPFVEEFAKAYGVLRRQFVIREPEDGFVYGATSGFGFSATENLLYGVAAFAIGGVPPAPPRHAPLPLAFSPPPPSRPPRPGPERLSA